MPIEQHAPELESILSTDQEIKELATGFGGDAGPAEGPLWWEEGGYLLFSDIGNNRRMKWTAGAWGISVLIGRFSACHLVRPPFSTATCSWP